ncbi:MAG: hypothetical protein JJU11_00015 [Candidatus Sumerlaeia bacterium]|nr:hypothetical protein [Candidatus Sumerlaeia bacterium]
MADEPSAVDHVVRNNQTADVLPPPAGAPGMVILLKKGRGLFQPDLWIVDADDSPRVWKTWRRKSAIERCLYGRRLARREGDILRRLDDLEGFPRFLSHPDPWTLEMTLLDAEPVPEVKGGGGLVEIYFDRLWGMLTEMHRRGINHGDLRRKNLMRAPGDPETPRMLDFTQSFSFQTPVRGIRAVLLREAIRVDRVTFLKLKRWYIGRENLGPEEIREMEAIPWHLQFGRFLRKRLYRPLKHLVQGKKRKKLK